MITQQEIITGFCTMAFEVLNLPLAETYQNDPGQIRTEDTPTANALDTHGTIQILQDGDFGTPAYQYKRNEQNQVSETVVNDQRLIISFNIMGKYALDTAYKLRACLQSITLNEKYFPAIGFNTATAIRDLTGANDHRNVPRRQFEVTFNVRQGIQVYVAEGGEGEVTQVYTQIQQNGVTRDSNYLKKP